MKWYKAIRTSRYMCRIIGKRGARANVAKLYNRIGALRKPYQVDVFKLNEKGRWYCVRRANGSTQHLLICGKLYRLIGHENALLPLNMDFDVRTTGRCYRLVDNKIHSEVNCNG